MLITGTLIFTALNNLENQVYIVHVSTHHNSYHFVCFWDSHQLFLLLFFFAKLFLLLFVISYSNVKSMMFVSSKAMFVNSIILTEFQFYIFANVLSIVGQYDKFCSINKGKKILSF